MSAGAPPTSPPVAPAPTPHVVRRRGDRGKLYTAIGAVAVVAVVVGVGAGTSWYGLVRPASSAGCPSGVTLQGQGAAFPSSIVLQWASEFGGASKNPVNYVPTSAGQGIAELTDKTVVDFAVTDEGLNASQGSALQAAVGPYLTLPVTGGAVVLIYDIPGLSSAHPLNLTANELAGIYLGQITTWDNATLVANNPALAGVTDAITAVHRADAAGMTYVLTNLLSDWNATWRTNPSLGTSILPDWPKFAGADPVTGNSEMLSAVKAPAAGDGTIGYTDLYDAEQKGLSMALIENAHGTDVAPTVADTTSAIDDVYNATYASLPPPTGDWSGVSWVNASGAGDYPLATLVYLLAPLHLTSALHTDTAAAAAALRWWIDWVATQGQYYSRTSFPFPSPPAPLLGEDLNATDAMTFGGASLPLCT
jgi:phosphate transport system substrate-binding protein